MARPIPFEVSRVQLDLEKIVYIPREAPVTMASLPVRGRAMMVVEWLVGEVRQMSRVSRQKNEKREKLKYKEHLVYVGLKRRESPVYLYLSMCLQIWTLGLR